MCFTNFIQNNMLWVGFLPAPDGNNFSADIVSILVVT